jgi:mannose-6-phosphate isomerase-like protein (cupin superfamily)
MLIGFDTRRIAEAPDAIAPDGSEVRLLGVLPRGSMAAFRLAPGAVSKAVAHRTVEEIWYFIAGQGDVAPARRG